MVAEQPPKPQQTHRDSEPQAPAELGSGPELHHQAQDCAPRCQNHGDSQHQHQHQHHHCNNDTNAPPPAPSAAAKDQSQLEAANVAHFDALGHDFDKHHPDAADFADRLARALRRLLVLDEDATAVLDYACGSGQVSRALASYVAQLVGVDISPRMVGVYNARANAQGLEPHEMRAVGALAELHQQRFDIAVCSMAYHHFASVQDVTRELAQYLKPRGTLAVADIARLEADEGDAPIMAKYEHIVAHTRGFTEGEMRAVFEGAGLENVAYERFASAKKEGRDVQFFLATGTKPANS